MRQCTIVVADEKFDIEGLVKVHIFTTHSLILKYRMLKIGGAS